MNGAPEVKRLDLNASIGSAGSAPRSSTANTSWPLFHRRELAPDPRTLCVSGRRHAPSDPRADTGHGLQLGCSASSQPRREPATRCEALAGSFQQSVETMNSYCRPRRSAGP